MRILVTGASGLIGSALGSRLTAAGHEVIGYDRAAPPSLDSFDAVVHLAGENIAGRWTEEKKRRIRSSRVDFTRRLCEGLAAAARRPRVLLSASATGYYGDRGAEELSEDSERGAGFLADVTVDWERATLAAERAGIRVAHLRFWVVLDAERGALAKMLPAFKLGVGGIIGSGRQYWSWIQIADAVGAMEHLIATASARGPVNLVSPQPVMNREFSQTLGRVVRRLTLLPMPVFATRLALGQMAEALLASARVMPARLEGMGYRFLWPDLESAMTHSWESRATKRPNCSARAGSVSR